MMDAAQPRTIGQRLREIRHWRGKTLRVVAELAGISESYLSRLASMFHASHRMIFDLVG
jgi:transcriptional regulator with XRE-family HTH domain